MAEKELVLSKIDEMRDEAVELFQQLIRIPSPNPPGDEREIADFCAAYMRDLGMEVEQIEPYKRRVSNVGRLRGKVGKPTLLFNSHVDVYPPPRRHLRYPPYAAEIHDGCVWGQGTSNMKSGVAAALFAVKILKECGIQLNGDVMLTQCADELVGGLKGIVQLIAHGLIQEADFAVYTENHPKQHKGRDVIEIGCRGSVNLDITTYGFQQLYYYRKEGRAVNAVVKMAKVIQALDDMEFKNFPAHPNFPHHAEYALTTISPPKVPEPWSRIPDVCTITVSTGIVPGQTKDMVKNEIEEVLSKLKEHDPELEYEISNVRERIPSFYVERGSEEPIVKAVTQAVKEVTGRTLPIEGTQTTGDATHIYLKGKIPICKFIFNDIKGDILSKRTEADERQNIDRFIDTIKVYTTLMLNLLK